MKRNWDKIREILVRLEEEASAQTISLASFPEDEAEAVSYHMELLIEAGLVNGKMSKAMGLGPYDFFAMRLTWEGHEFLDAIRDETIWNKTKNSFVTQGLSMTFDLVRSVAVDITSSYLKKSLG